MSKKAAAKKCAPTSKKGDEPKMTAEDEATKDAGSNYCTEQAAVPGTHSLSSGVLFRISKPGPHLANQKSPTESDTVVVHYTGTLIDGTKFDSSFDRGEPSTFRVGSVIKGWTQVLTFMGEGDKWDVIIPQFYAYGSQKLPKIPPYSTLCFRIELIMVKTEGRPADVARKELSEHVEKPYEELLPKS